VLGLLLELTRDQGTTWSLVVELLISGTISLAAYLQEPEFLDPQQAEGAQTRA
jgi:hypothetical protein